MVFNPMKCRVRKNNVELLMEADDIDIHQDEPEVVSRFW